MSLLNVNAMLKKYTILFILTLAPLFFFNQEVKAQCAGNCGGFAGGCACDDDCWFWLDCCSDICDECPTVGPETILNCSGPTAPTGECNTDVSICTPGVAGPFNFEYMLGPPSDYADPIGCSTGVFPENNQFAFITLYITQSGPLNLLLQGNTGEGFLDVIVYNIPAGQAPCAAVLNDANEIGCNYASDPDGCVQFGDDFNCSSSVPAPNVNAGDVLMIIVNDYSLVGSDNFTMQLGPTGAQTGPPSSTINPPAITQFCLTDPGIQLTAQNNGGVWSGTGVSATGSFNPATAGVGTHTISYVIGQAPCQSPVSTIALTVVDCNVPCTANSLTVQATACTSATNTYAVGATFSFVSPPTTGQLIIEDCSGAQTVINPPFVSPITTGIAGLPSTGNSNCSLHAYFTANPTCEITTAYAAPPSCDCSANPPLTGQFVVDSVTCAGNDGAIDLTVSGGAQPYTYAWSPGSAGTQDLSGLSPGTYSVTVTDQIGCTYNSSVTVYGPTVLPLTISNQVMCSGDSLLLNPTAVPVGDATYTWEPAANFFGPNDATPTFTAVTPGNTVDSIWVSVLIESPTVCGQQTFFVAVLPEPVVELGLPGLDTTALCPNDSLLLTNTGDNSVYPGAAFTYVWNNNSTGSSLMAHTPGLYWVQWTNSAGCSKRDSLYINSETPPYVTIDSAFTMCGTETIPVYGSGYDSTVTLLWNTGATTDTIFVNTPGTYSLVVTNGCSSDTASTQVIQIPVLNADQLPNVFTPNGDGLNDVYDLNDAFYYSNAFHVQIFNRWGSKVYDTQDPQINWTAKNLSDGVYYMAILYTDCNNEQKKLAHSVTVIGK